MARRGTRKQVHYVFRGWTNRRGAKRAMMMLKDGCNFADVLCHYMVMDRNKPRHGK